MVTPLDRGLLPCSRAALDVGNVAVVLAEEQVRAIRRVCDSVGAARRRAAVLDILKDSAGLGVEDSDGLWRAHLQDGGGVIAKGVESDGLGAGGSAEVDLGTRGGNDRAVTDDPRVRQGRRVVRALRPAQVLAWGVRRELYGLAHERRNAQPCRQQAGEQVPPVNLKMIARSFSVIGKQWSVASGQWLVTPNRKVFAVLQATGH